MTYTPEPINLTPDLSDCNVSAWIKVEHNYQAIKGELSAGRAGFDHVKTALTGGGSDALNGIDGAGLSDSETAIVLEGNDPAVIRLYVLDEDSGLAESLPDIVAPLNSPGDKRWILAGYAPRLGMAAGTACEGNDGRLVTLDEKDAMAGTAGMPSDGNRFVTNSDPRLTDSRDPHAHSASHQHSGSDEIATSTAAANAIPKADATGKIAEGFLPTGFDLDFIANTLQLKRGTQAEALAASLAAGEPMLVTDTPLLCISDGSTTYLVSSVLIGPEASRPDPTVSRLFYFCSDTKALYVSDGTAWVWLNPKSELSSDEIEAASYVIYWDVHSVDTDYSKGLNDRFVDESGVDTGASTAAYNAEGDHYGPVIGAPAQTDVDPTSDSDLDRRDLFTGDTVYWQNTSTAKGYFSSDSAGSNRLTIKDVSADYPDVKEGIRIEFSGGAQTIIAVTNDGDQDDEVELNADLTDATLLTGAFGLYMDSGALKVSGLADPDGANNPSTDYATPAMTSNSAPSPYVALASSEQSSSYYAYEAFDHDLSYNTGWLPLYASGLPSWVQIDCGFGNEKIINKFRIRVGANNSRPTAFSFLGSQNGSDWDTLDTRSGYTWVDYWSDWFTFSNGTAYRYYLLYVTAADSGGRPYICELHLVELSTVIPTEQFAANTAASMQLDTSTWGSITGITVTQSTPGSSTVYHAVSKNKGDSAEEWSVFLSSAWRSIARLNSSTWEYKDSGGSWQTATINSRLGALSQAFSVSENQMDKTGLEAISDYSGWFTAGTLDFACALQADGTDVPTLTKYTVDYTIVIQDFELITNSWEETADDPDDAYCVLEVEPLTVLTLNTDLTASISMDDGTNYEQITGLSIIREIDDRQLIKGVITGLTARTDKTMRLKVNGHNNAQFNLHAIAAGVRYT